MKHLLTIIATALVAGGAVYVWQNQQADAPAAGGGFGGGMGGGFQQAPPLVTVAAVDSDELYDTVNAIGTAIANESLTVTAKVTDTVSAVDFEDGDYVEAGAVLVHLTNVEEEALLAEGQANFNDAQTQFTRIQDLARQNLISEAELDIARSRMEASQARLDTVVARLSDRLILAPFAGVLGFRQVSPGTLLQPNTPITTLDDVSIIKLDFTVPEAFLGEMTPGATVFARAASYPDRQFEGIVRTVGSRIDPVTRAVQIRAHIANDEGLLRPGMLLTVGLVMGSRTALVISENAIFQIQDRAYVYVIDSEQIARQREVETGTRLFGRVEILGGLEAGESVVTEGIVKLRDGARVRLTEPNFEVIDPRAGAGG